MIQKSCFDGLFYPKKKEALEHLILTLFNTVKDRKKVAIKGLISPHAGYQYSGNIAAEAIYEMHHKPYKTAIILGPSHRFLFSGASCLDKQTYQTPLGNVAINQKVVKKIIQTKTKKTLRYDPKAYEKEHSIEVILPFLQVLQPNITIVPIVVGNIESTQINTITNLLINECDEKETVVITSTDFSHFFSEEEAKKKDTRAIELIKKQAIKDLEKEQEKETIQLCGIGPLLIMLTLLKKWKIKTVEHLSYSHSGMVTGDATSVVGYNSFRCY